MIKDLLDRPGPATALVVALLLVTTWGVTYSPRSIVLFMLFQGSILLLYFARIPTPLKAAITILTLGVLMPVLGTINAYYMEIAIQVGIFVALALGLNIVVGLAGLLDLGYVAFFAVGAYSWAIFGSPQANLIFGARALSPRPVVVLRVPLRGSGGGGGRGHPARPSGAAAPRRLPGPGDPRIRRGDPRARQQSRQADQLHNGPKGITPINRPPIFFAPLLRSLGIDPDPNVIYPLYLYASCC